MVSLGVHMMVHSLSHGEFSPAFLGLDVETCILIGLSVLLVLVRGHGHDLPFSLSASIV